jgi:large subunit ribosomal protein L32
MANPKHKISRARRDKRRAHHALGSPALTLCPQCREPKLPHRVCPSCGTYRGRDVIPVKEV